MPTVTMMPTTTRTKLVGASHHQTFASAMSANCRANSLRVPLRSLLLVLRSLTADDNSVEIRYPQNRAVVRMYKLSGSVMFAYDAGEKILLNMAAA